MKICIKNLSILRLRLSFGKQPKLPSTTEQDFDKALNGMKGISERAHDWLLNHAHPMHWVELYFHGRRYGHITSNIAESLNAALLEAREKPILGMFEHTRHKLMEWYVERRQINLNNLLFGQIDVFYAAKKIQELTAWQAQRYRVLPCTDTEFEVFHWSDELTMWLNWIL